MQESGKCGSKQCMPTKVLVFFLCFFLLENRRDGGGGEGVGEGGLSFYTAHCVNSIKTMIATDFTHTHTHTEYCKKKRQQREKLYIMQLMDNSH